MTEPVSLCHTSDSFPSSVRTSLHTRLPCSEPILSSCSISTVIGGLTFFALRALNSNWFSPVINAFFAWSMVGSSGYPTGRSGLGVPHFHFPITCRSHSSLMVKPVRRSTRDSKPPAGMVRPVTPAATASLCASTKHWPMSLISLAEHLPSTLVMYSFSIVNAGSSARTGVTSAAAGTAAGVSCFFLAPLARLALPDPGSCVGGS